MNIVILKGNITRPLEVTYLPKGTPVLELGLAENSVWYDEEGEKHEEVTFVDCRAWGKRAETIARLFTKGSPILIHGKLRQERWEDKATGKARSKTLVVIEHWEFAGDTRKGTSQSGDSDEPPARSEPKTVQQPPPVRNRAAEPHQEGPITDGFEDDDIPF